MMNAPRLALKLLAAGLACIMTSPDLVAAEGSGAASPAYILRTMPLRHESADPEARAPVERLWNQVLGELRDVPGITLLPAGAVLAPGDDRPEYQLTIASLRTTALANGSESYTSLYEPMTRGMYTAMSPHKGGAWPIEIRVERNGRDTTRSTINAITFLFKEGLARSPMCQRELKPEMLRTGSECWSSPELAMRIAESLRMEKLPPDEGMYRRLVGRIADASLGERERSIALNSLVIARRAGRFTFDDAGITAIDAFSTAATSAMRAQIWSTLGGVSPPQLVPAMLQTMQSDPLDETRLKALETLTADHGGDPRVRIALAKVARDDTSDFNRVLAKRALGDDTAWRDYLIVTVKNDRFSAQQRTDPLLYMQGRFQDAQVRALVRTPALTEAVLDTARDNFSVTDIGSRGVLRRALNMLLQYADPALLASHADWTQLQKEFSAGRLAAAPAPPEWTGLPPLPIAPPAR